MLLLCQKAIDHKPLEKVSDQQNFNGQLFFHLKKKVTKNVYQRLKKEICIFHMCNKTLKQNKIATYFNSKYSLNIDRTTISKIINNNYKWLSILLKEGDV